MQARLTTKPQEDVIAAIQALDLESVRTRLMDPQLGKGWTREYSERIEAAYKNYLTMVVKYQEDAEDILLSKDVDEFWHTHILQTMKYASDCQNVFGVFLHHDPHVGKIDRAVLDKRELMAERTRQIYEKEFGGELGAQSAWTGGAIGHEGAAMSNIRIKPTQAAMSNLRIGSQEAAMSNLRIRGENAAMSNLKIRSEEAAMSNLRIDQSAAAMSNLRIAESDAAMSNLRIPGTEMATAGRATA